jgi:hypothetical protein
MEKIKLSMGQVRQAVEPNQIRYLLITSLITNSAKEWQKNVDNPAFYREAIGFMKEWIDMSDDEMRVRFPSLPYKV